jgi:hypothetical protein
MNERRQFRVHHYYNMVLRQIRIHVVGIGARFIGMSTQKQTFLLAHRLLVLLKTKNSDSEIHLFIFHPLPRPGRERRANRAYFSRFLSSGKQEEF